MNEEVIILIAEDDEGHAVLIKKNLKRAGITNKIIHFKNGQETLDFLFARGSGPHRDHRASYLLLLDIRMPQIDGIEVLRKVKQDKNICRIPVIMITTTDDPREVNTCHELGCSSYITKPIDYENFIETTRKLGLFLSIVRVPSFEGEV